MSRRDRWWCLEDMIFALGLAVALLGLALLGCGNKPGPRHPDLVTERRECLNEPPPKPTSPRWESCPGFVACLDRDSAVRLIDYLTRLRRYADDAWLRCGPLSGGAKPGPTQPLLVPLARPAVSDDPRSGSGGPIGVGLVVRVPGRAVRHRGVFGAHHLWRKAASSVLASRDRLQVARVAARANPAQMVEVEPGRHRTDQRLECDPVSYSGNRLAKLVATVPRRGDVRGPQPASALADAHLTPEAFGEPAVSEEVHLSNHTRRIRP